MAYIYDLTDTWSAAGTVFNGIKLNVTNTASASGSKLMTLQVGGTEFFGVSKEGDVRIGNGGDLRLGSATGTTAPTGDSSIYNDANDMIFATGTTTAERMRITSGGNLGIGTNSPGTKLQVSAANTAGDDNTGNVFVATTDAQAANVGGKLTFGGLYNGSSTYAFGGLAGRKENSTSNNVAGYLQFLTTTSAGALTERARIDSAGNVGIGTSSPGYKLVVGGASGSTTTPTALSMDDTYASAPAWDRLKFYLFKNSTESYGLGLGVSADMQYWAGPTNDGMHVFYTRQTERMRIDSSGNLLVGTTTSFGKLSVFGTAGFNADSNAAISGSGSHKFRGAAAGTTISTYDYLNYTAMQFIRDNGNPTNTVGSITCTDTATTYNTSSDRRLKKDIVPASEAGAIIDSIDIVSHGWKSSDGVVPFGVVAQDLHAVAPQAVHAGDNADEIESVWGVDYSKLVPMLIKEVQSLRARVAQLEGN